MIEQAKEILCKLESRSGQGERDFKVLLMHLDGDSLEYIAQQCSWLKDFKSVQIALYRIINSLRIELGAEVSNSIVLKSNENKKARDQRTVRSQSDYYKQWYEKNKARQQEKNREYKRNKRQSQK